MECPKCNEKMQEGIVIVDAPQSFFRWGNDSLSGLCWLNEKLENYSKWKLVKDRKRLIPIGLKKEDLRKSFLCENCKISVIEY